MSTKCTISHDDTYHLFYECGDEDNIYLQIDNSEYVEFNTWGKVQKIVVSIPGKLYNKLVREGEVKSWSGEDFDNPKSPEQRKQDWDEGFESTMSMLEDMKKRREEKEKKLNESITRIQDSLRMNENHISLVPLNVLKDDINFLIENAKRSIN